MSTTDNAKNETPRIYVACLAAYNNGRLHGRWIDAAQEADDIQTDVQAMLAESPQPGAEEWAIHDSDGFGPITIHEHESFADVAALAAFIEARPATRRCAAGWKRSWPRYAVASR